MLTLDEIRLLIEAGEGYNAEFKLAVPNKVKEISEEVCAFANAAGGVLLFAVNDNNQLKGIHIDNAKRSESTSVKATQKIREKTREKIRETTTQKIREKTTQKTTQKIESLLIELLIANPESSRTKLAQDLGDITTDGVKYHLNKLKKQGKIERIGPDKGGYWKVNKKP